MYFNIDIMLFDCKKELLVQMRQCNSEKSVFARVKCTLMHTSNNLHDVAFIHICFSEGIMFVFKALGLSWIKYFHGNSFYICVLILFFHW